MRKIKNSKPLVSIIIVNLNGIGHLKKCLPSLAKQNYKNIEIILVDNASIDGSVSWVRKYYPKIKLIINKENLGFAEPNNVGYRATKGDYILFLNNDTYVTKNFLVEALKVLESDETIGGVQTKIRLMDKPSRLDCVGSFLTNTGFLYHNGLFKRDSEKFNKQIEIYSAKGASMIFKRKVLEEIKVDGEVLDSSSFAYFEETDMCHRVWLAGYKILFAPRSIIYHKFGATASEQVLKPFLEFHSYKNRIASYIKNLGPWRLVQILPVHLATCWGLIFLYLIKGQWQISLAIARAIVWVTVNLGSILRKRDYIQSKIRKVRDDEIFPTIYKSQGLGYYFWLLGGARA